MLGNVCGRNWCDRPPAVAKNESRHSSWESNASSQNCARDGGDERRVWLAGVFVFGGCAAAIRLRLTDDAFRSGTLRVFLVHRARALGAARHARFRRRRPPGAHCGVAGRDENGQDKREQSPAESQHTSRMQDRETTVNSSSSRDYSVLSRPMKLLHEITVATPKVDTAKFNAHRNRYLLLPIGAVGSGCSDWRSSRGRRGVSWCSGRGGGAPTGSNPERACGAATSQRRSNTASAGLCQRNLQCSQVHGPRWRHSRAH